MQPPFGLEVISTDVQDFEILSSLCIMNVKGAGLRKRKKENKREDR
jgi:hypothetical protein